MKNLRDSLTFELHVELSPLDVRFLSKGLLVLPSTRQVISSSRSRNEKRNQQVSVSYASLNDMPRLVIISLSLKQ